MKLTFSWQEFSGLRPYCRSNVINKDGVSLLSDLLMDDGGISYLTTLSWIERDIAITEAIFEGRKARDHWSRETWGAEIGSSEVWIYSMHGEEYTEHVTKLIFHHALTPWRDFILSPREARQVIEVELSPNSGASSEL